MEDRHPDDASIRALEERGITPSHAEVVGRLDGRLIRRQRRRWTAGLAFAAITLLAAFQVLAADERSDDLHVQGDKSISPPSSDAAEATGSAGDGATPGGDPSIDLVRVEAASDHPAGTTEVTLLFDGLVPDEEAIAVDALRSARETELSFTTQSTEGSDVISVCGADHWFPSPGNQTVDVLIPIGWLAPDAVFDPGGVVWEPDAAAPAKIIVCEPRADLVQISIWGAASGRLDDVSVTVVGDRIEIAIAAAPPSHNAEEPEVQSLGPGWEPLGSIAATDIDLLAVSEDAVVLGSESGVTTIDNDGSVRTGEAGPLDSADCCGPPFLPVLAVAADDEVIAVSRSSGAAIALDVDTLSWTEFAAPPIEGPVLDAAWTGSELIVVVITSDAVSTENGTHLVALDPSAGSWRVLPAPPQPLNRGGVATLDDRVVLSGTVQGFGNVIVGDREPHVFELVGDEWTTVESPPIDGQAAVALPLDGGYVAWNYGLSAAVYDGRGWRLAADLPGPAHECTPDGHWTIAGVITNGCGGLAVFDDDLATWTQIDDIALPDRFRYWAVGEDRVVVVDTVDPDLVTVYEYQLAPVASPPG